MTDLFLILLPLCIGAGLIWMLKRGETATELAYEAAQKEVWYRYLDALERDFGDRA